MLHLYVSVHIRQMVIHQRFSIAGRGVQRTDVVLQFTVLGSMLLFRLSPLTAQVFAVAQELMLSGKARV